MRKGLVSILTPCYNGESFIHRLLDSILAQTYPDVEMIVVDDGSTDNTRELVEKWIEEKKIPIRYIYQQNQGMHGAHNTAYKNIHTELNTCIDSDDYMPDDAVEKICFFWKEHGSDRYAGIIGLDVTENGKVIGTGFPTGLKETTLADFYLQGGSGDKKLVYRTSVIRQYPEYPLFEGERYVGLAYKYMLIDQDYKLLTLNEPLVVVEYQEDGSSVNMYRQYWNNPKGFAFFRKAEMVTTKSAKRRFMVCIHYVSSSFIAKNKHFIKESPRKLTTLLAIPFGYLLYRHIAYKVKKNAKMNVQR